MFRTSRRIAVPMVIGAVLLVAGVALAVHEEDQHGFQSVELNLSEVSPNGAAGGYAVPASGASTPSGLRATCAQSGTSVTLQWGASQASDAGGSVPVASHGFEFLTAYAGGGGETPPPATPTHTVQPVSYDLCVGTATTNCNIYRNTSYGGTSWSGSVSAGQRYYWEVRACSGGECSSYNSTSFECAPPPPPPTVTLYVNDGSGETTSDITIDPIDQLTLRWTASGATSCSATTNPSGGNFSTGGATSGTDADVTEPYAGTSRTYIVTCVNSAGVPGQDQIRVSANIGVPPVISASPEYVRKGEEATLIWNTMTNVPATCTITGPGIATTPTSITGRLQATINGESTYTMTCPGGSDSVTVEILPTVQET